MSVLMAGTLTSARIPLNGWLTHNNIVIIREGG